MVVYKVLANYQEGFPHIGEKGWGKGLGKRCPNLGEEGWGRGFEKSFPPPRGRSSMTIISLLLIIHRAYRNINHTSS
jgi:hypothetical protein